ncbi:MAG: hypothetical protein CL610_00305 [Anaerolineaceae bacterium]|nr:hypothetical protein [Anaerolineaceae bacterium]
MTETLVAQHGNHIDEKNFSAAILVVEDDVNLLEGIRNILEIDGYTVHTAENGLEALEVLRQSAEPPDLILSDIMMPHMNGTQLLAAVRDEPSWLSIPFIFLTARGEKADIQKGKEMGVEDYIVKPYDPIDLLITIRARLRRRDEIESVHATAMTQLKRNILTILNHEFRTPLTFVVAYADMLNAPTPEKLDDSEMLSFLKGISTGADRLRNLIENFILLVELETGEARETFNWRKQPVTDLENLLETVCQNMFGHEDVAHQYELIIENDIAPFVGDEDYLRRALQQLVDNAIKFSPADAPIYVSAGTSPDGCVEIRVQDGGRGIPPHELKSIWDTFYQVNRPFYEDQGAGSGLAIVRRIVELHGGEVLIDTAVNEGSIFTLRIPAVR